MNEETVNKFTVGAKILGVNMYWELNGLGSVHLLLDNGAMLIINGPGDDLDVDVLGPSDPTEALP